MIKKIYMIIKNGRENKIVKVYLLNKKIIASKLYNFKTHRNMFYFNKESVLLKFIYLIFFTIKILMLFITTVQIFFKW